MSHWRDFLDSDAPSGRYLAWKEVARRTSLSRTTAWRLQRRDEFPRSYAISPGRVGHLEAEVEAWIASRSQPGAAPARTIPVAPPGAVVNAGGSVEAVARIGRQETARSAPLPERPSPPASGRRKLARGRTAPVGQQITFNF